jgi:hypothetical protein
MIFFLQEKELLRKKREEIEEAEQAKRNKVVVTFDLVGRKVFNASPNALFLFGCHLDSLLHEFLFSQLDLALVLPISFKYCIFLRIFIELLSLSYQPLLMRIHRFFFFFPLLMSCQKRCS